MLGSNVVSSATFGADRERVLQHRFVGLQHRDADRALGLVDRGAESRAGEEDRVRAAALAVARQRDEALDDRRA